MCVLLTSMVSLAATHGYVDLGLPSGTLWATCNVGASAPEDYGSYFAWGETTTKSSYSWSNYKYASGTAATATYIGDFLPNNNKVTTIQGTQYDAAKAQWGSEWVMPSKDQVHELIQKCSVSAKTVNGVKGVQYKGPNGNTMFLPCGGFKSDATHTSKGTEGYYWSGTGDVYDLDKSRAVALYNKSSSVTTGKNIQRRTGANIRAVRASGGSTEPTASDPEAVDLGLSVKWATFNVGATSKEKTGTYFAWGETSKKSSYTWANYQHASGSSTTCKSIGSDISETQYDAARKTWGDDWRMPTASEIEELRTKCTWTAATVSGVKGYTVKGPSGKTIFLPFSGCSFEGKTNGAGTYAYYWSSEVSEGATGAKAYALYPKSGTSTTKASIQRRTGAVIRPVKGAGVTPTPTQEEMDLVDLGLSVKWANMNIEADNVEKTGYYYAWGETSKKSSYTWANYKHSNGTQATAKFIGDDISGDEQYDAAKSWCYAQGDALPCDFLSLPTAEQWQELISKCTWTSTTKNGVKGYTVKGPSGKSIFLPLSGCSYEGKNYTDNTYYWTANYDASTAYKAQAVKLTASAKSVTSIQRRTGAAIRAVAYIEHSIIIPVTPPPALSPELVDLGLSVKWSNQDVGSTCPGLFGDYFAWGETSTKSTYTWANYKHSNGTQATAKNIGSNISGTSYDAAYADDKQMCLPTVEQWNELISKCTFKLVDCPQWDDDLDDYVEGKAYEVTGPNGNSILLPLSGSSYEGKENGVGANAYYWTANNDASTAYKAKATYLTKTSKSVTSIQRRTGAAIRPVEKKSGGSSTTEAYAVLSTDKTTLTFYYDAQKASRSGTKYALNTGSNEPEWSGTYSNNHQPASSITKVVFNSSFANARPTSCNYWFAYMSNLTSITGMNYLNTSEVTRMSYMFYNCKKLTSIDLSHFDTRKVIFMNDMFCLCENLTSLNVSSFNTANVTHMAWMFADCFKLTSLDLSNFNTSKVENMGSMFYADNFTSLDLSNFNTENVIYFYNMFENCKKLKHIDLSSFSAKSAENMESMFKGCDQIAVIDLSAIDFNSKQYFNNDYMFSGCPNLQEIDINATAKYWSSNACYGVPDGCFLVYPIGSDRELSLVYSAGIYIQFKGGNFVDLGDDIIWATTDFIDLGLPSKILWNDENVGSIRPQYHGLYYAWAEVEPKSDYTWGNYSQDVSNLKDYDFGYWNGNSDLPIGQMSYNGNLYRSGVPTNTEFTELVNNCTLTETTISGVKGVKFTSKNNGKFIFLPYAGSYYDGKTPDDVTASYYWTSTSSGSQKAYSVSLKGGKATSTTCQMRTGLPYRTVARYVRKMSSAGLENANSGNFYVDGISNVKAQTPADGAIYTLQGVKVEGALKPGIYIKNGRKFVVK